MNIERKSIKLTSTRLPILIEENIWLPVYRFEEIYEIDLYGNIRKASTKEYLPVYVSKNGIQNVVLRHPNGHGSALTCRLIDVYTSTVLGDKSLDKYHYFD